MIALPEWAKAALAATFVVAYVVATVLAVGSVIEDGRGCRAAGGRMIEYHCYEAKSLREVRQ